MIRSRVARPARDLARSVEFYRDRLGLVLTGGFRGHEGYDGAFFALPAGGELELTAGPVTPTGWSEDDLLVLYVADRAALQRWVDALDAHGVESVRAANPYWNRVGHTVLDPDGPRAELRSSFELAEDSAEQLAHYIDLGQVLVARRDNTIVGHLQLVPTGTEHEIELKNMAVLADHQGAGVGRSLVDEAMRRCGHGGFTRMIVSTATADAGNIRFYQRVGFRMRGVENDAFTPDTGYPQPILIDGIELRDRVWFDCTLTASKA